MWRVVNSHSCISLKGTTSQKKMKLNKIFVRTLNTLRKTSIPTFKVYEVQQDKKLLKPLTHIQNAMTSHIDLYWSFNYWLKVPADKGRAVEEFMRNIHIGVIMLDDILDMSPIRYYVPAAHKLYSIPLTANAANHATILALQNIIALEPKALDIYLEEILNFYRGQGMDYYWQSNIICPTEEEHFDMITKKTSSFIIMSCRLHKLFSHDKNDYTKLGNLLGIYYQLRNDYCNFLDEQHEGNKAYCNDITTGCITLPVIHAINKSDKASELLNILRQRTQDPDLKRYFMSLLDNAGSFKYTEQVLTDLESEIYKEIKGFGGNPELEATMERLCDWKKCKI